MFALAAATGLAMTAQASAAVISVNFTNASGSGVTSWMGPTELAGAPGVRVDDWNNLNAAGSAFALTDDTGAATTASATLTLGSGSLSNRDGGALSNDQKLYSGIAESTSEANTHTVTVTSVPYALYDVYVYVREENSDQGARVTVGDTTYYVRGTTGSNLNPNSSGVGYVLSTDTTITPNTDASVDQGNYVRFQNVTASTLAIAFGAADLSSGAPRGRIGGFQIVAVPEPASLALVGLGAALMLRRPRD